MKVGASVRLLCKSCRAVRRLGTLRIVCNANPKHKQRQG